MGAGATSLGGSIGSALALFSTADSTFSVVGIDSITTGRVSTGAGRVVSCGVGSSAMVKLSRLSSDAKLVDNGTVVHASQRDSTIAIGDGVSNARIDGDGDALMTLVMYGDGEGRAAVEIDRPENHNSLRP